MFTATDKIKERVLYFIKQDTPCLVYPNKNFKPVGVSVVMTYKYNVNGMEIIYNKWFVEAFELAQQFNLLGCEHHNQLVKGSGVTVFSREFGMVTFYGKNAEDIINSCESCVFQKQR